MVDVSVAAFEELVTAALDSLPEELGRVFNNVVVLVEDENAGPAGPARAVRGSPADGARDVVLRRPPRPRHDLPPAHPEALRDIRAEVVDDVRITVIHELAHHLGIDDDRLHDLGYG